jgi:hypothetical protein
MQLKCWCHLQMCIGIDLSFIILGRSFMYVRKSKGPNLRLYYMPLYYIELFFDIYFPDTIYKVHNRYHLFNKISV